tara:strand:+ start:939 stop:1322 length:384 start_codon:yes stop_codon:yes gene_type:complete
MGRRLKPTWKRKPDESVPHSIILSEVSRSTGFTKADIETVIDTWLLILKEELLERKSVKLRNIGTLFPMVQPPRKVTNMGGQDVHNYDNMVMEARWKIKFQTDSELMNDVRDIMVTKRDLDKIYYKD